MLVSIMAWLPRREVVNGAADAPPGDWTSAAMMRTPAAPSRRAEDK
jgi:hypothetical protein